MTTRFAYLLERVRDTPLVHDPFRHLRITDFLSPEDFAEVRAASAITLPPADVLDQLFEHLDEAGYERIDFPGCVNSREAYVRWLDEQQEMAGTKKTCEAQGLAFRLATHDGIVDELDRFFRSDELHDLVRDRFGLNRPTSMEGGVQKYLHGYEISPHPDIRRKALTWMLNVNPGSASEELPIHTHYMRLLPEFAWVEQLWRDHPTLETCWVPWDWCTTTSRQTDNNSIVFFSPAADTMHAVRSHYDHLPAQRTQFYGNLWFDHVEPPVELSPDHEDLVAVHGESGTGDDLFDRLQDRLGGRETGVAHPGGGLRRLVSRARETLTR